MIHLTRGELEMAKKTDGQKIREARIARGWSQEKLAELAGTKQQQVQRLEADKIAFSRDTAAVFEVLGIAAPLGHPMDDLIPCYSTEATPEGVRLTGVKVREERRTSSLALVPGAYGYFVRASRMAPIFRPGDLLLVDPQRPAASGDRVILRDANDATSLCIICELIEDKENSWLVKDMIRGEFEVEKSEFPHAHLIVACMKV